MKRVTIILTTIFVLTSCSKENKESIDKGHVSGNAIVLSYIENSPSYITGFSDIAEITVSERNPENCSIIINFDHKQTTGVFYSIRDDKRHSEYIRLCKAVGDTTYNKTIDFTIDSEVDHWSYIHNISLINITAKEDWDETHLEDSSLNDLFVCKTISFYDFIQEEYLGEPAREKSFIVSEFHDDYGKCLKFLSTITLDLADRNKLDNYKGKAFVLKIETDTGKSLEKTMLL